jgi:hypothetical protein
MKIPQAAIVGACSAVANPLAAFAVLVSFGAKLVEGRPSTDANSPRAANFRRGNGRLAVAVYPRTLKFEAVENDESR